MTSMREGFIVNHLKFLSSIHSGSVIPENEDADASCEKDDGVQNQVGA